MLQALVSANEKYALAEHYRVLTLVRGIAFLGTPFRGSWNFGSLLAEKRVQHSIQRNNEFSRELTQYLRPSTREHRSPLEGLREQLHNLLESRRPFCMTVCFFETRRSTYIARIKKLPTSADMTGLDPKGSDLVS